MSDPIVPPVAPELVNVQIDGIWHKVVKGTRMIEACKQVEKNVPHYCYHPKLSSPGNCRMCLVEMGMPARPAPGQEVEKDEFGMAKIGWMPRPVIACANTVSEGMGIRTQSLLTEESRKSVMEFLLINHPLDCPICDQAGECRLQEFSVEHGKAESRFREEKVKKPKNVNIGPRVRLDDERCIMCSRCIRFSAEIVDDPVLGFTERGSYTTLSVHPGKQLANDYSLNTVDICPVGALTSNDFRFKMRTWFLKETESICTGCGTGCNIEIHARGDEIMRQTPRENNEVNSHWMCDQGRLDFHFVNSELRLTEPLLRQGKHHVEVRWSEMISKLAEVLKSESAENIGIITSARMTNEELMMVKLLADQLGVTQLDVVPRTGKGDSFLRSDDLNPNTQGAKLIFGFEPGSRLEKIRVKVARGEMKILVVLGENLLKIGFKDEDVQKVGHLFVGHVLANASAQYAQGVLPLTTYAEKTGTMINTLGRLQKLNAAIQPIQQSRQVWQVVMDLLKILGGAEVPTSVEQIHSVMTEKYREFSGINLDQVGSKGVALVDTGVKVPLLEREQERIKKGIIVG
jgi:NADH-quinone oxidoreductase subunit G